MIIVVKRTAKMNDYTIGNLYIDGQFFCNTLEDTDRGLSDSQSLLYSHPLKTIFQHKACTDKLYADSFYKVQKNSHSSFEVICCRS